MRVEPGRTAIHGPLVLVLVAGIAFSAHAAGEGDMRSYVNAIDRAYESLDYEHALAQIQRARQVARGTEEEVTLSLYEGIILYELGKPESGLAAFKSALFLRPDAKLPKQVAPKITQSFESVRKQVKRELGPLLQQRERERLPDKAEPSRAALPASSATGNATPARQGAEPVVQPLAPPDCGPLPSGGPGQTLKEQQLWRLAILRRDLCSSGRFKGLLAAKWSGLKERMEGAKDLSEQTLLRQEIDQFSQGLNPSSTAAQPRADASGPPAGANPSPVAPAQTDTSGCQAAVRAGCERLLKQRLQAQELFLSTKPFLSRIALWGLDTIGQQIQAASTPETLGEAERALNTWQERYVPAEKN